MARVTGLSGNEVFCLSKKDYEPGNIVVGNSVNSMGFLKSFGAGYNNMLGGEVTQVSQQIHDARQAAFARMKAEAQSHGADGVAGVTSELIHSGNNTEFLFVGSALHNKGGLSRAFFTSAGNAQELYCHMDAGYRPVDHVFGNIAYSMGVGGSFSGSLRTMKRGEVREFSDIFNATRHSALDRIVVQAKQEKANAVIGIRTNIMPWHGTHEMTMTGTAAIHPGLPESASRTPVTSDLTGEELWTMAGEGYAPLKLLMSTSIYSIGMKGALKSFFKSFTQGEIPELTTLVHDARESCLDRIHQEADMLNADMVVGTKTYLSELGSGLIEYMAIGTAVRKMPGMKVETPVMPAQAIIHDKDTWIFDKVGFSLEP